MGKSTSNTPQARVWRKTDELALPTNAPNDEGKPKRDRVHRLLMLIIGLITIWSAVVNLRTMYKRVSGIHHASANESAGVSNALAGYCSSIPPITAKEFHERQAKLADTLSSLNASAYIMEPGANAQYFANVSSTEWRLSERPLLFAFSYEDKGKRGRTDIRPKLTVLTPSFEATRAKLLHIPAADNVTWVEWAEEADPYEVLINALAPERCSLQDIYVDPSARMFIGAGLAAVAPKVDVSVAPVEVRRLRERKSPAEIKILRCANEATLQAIRTVRQQMNIGITESRAKMLISSYLQTAGLTNAGCLVLFGQNAALPHGSGTDRLLGRNDMALFDCGGTLHGYHCDITRTFAVGMSQISSEHIEMWYFVHAAQMAAFRAAKNGTKGADVDKAARRVFDALGYGEGFTHRLGHGIGLEGHESPYLNGGSQDIILTGHTFSNEPGLYFEGKLGVRLEDIFYIDEDGEPRYLTEGVGGPAQSPWLP